MTLNKAKQIADLINERNQLVIKYTAEKILAVLQNYVYLEDKEKIIACAEIKRVQWYQWEVSHVLVAKEYEGKGYGSKILKLAEDKAQIEGAKILQCTIRLNNENSLRLFTRNNFKKVNRFYNSNTKNFVFVFQKTVS